MATLSTEAPDPKTFQSWEDAFKYPVPAVRRMQQQLRGDINTNRERLRTLVGSSYRDLLSTADSIVHMDVQMASVETHLSATSRRCNTSLLQKSNANALRLTANSLVEDRQNFTRASQLAVFRACPDAVARILRKKGSVLLAAKVLIVGRLVHKQLVTAGEKGGYVEGIWSRLGRSRAKILATIDRRLCAKSLETAGLVDALCAYSLVTSTRSSGDILKHFHYERLDGIQSRLSHGAEVSGAVLEALRLWIRTLQDTRALFPRLLSNALGSLRAVPLLKDESLRSVEEFDFELREQWLGEDVRNFVPYIRRDDMTASDAAKQLSSWAPAALKTMLGNLKTCLENFTSLTEVIELRKGCLELLFSHYNISGVRRNGVLNGFRDAFEKRLLDIVRQRCEGLSEISNDVKEILEEWESHGPQEIRKDLWDTTTTSMSIQHGAKQLRNIMVTTVNGQTNASRMITEHYEAWLSRIEEVDKIITSMRNTRWEDHLDDFSDDDDEDSDEESEATLSKTKVLLKETDPASIKEALTTELQASFEKFRKSVDELAETVTGDNSNHAKSAFLLRVLREVRSHIPLAHSGQSLQFKSIPALHSTIASPAITMVVEKHESAVAKSVKRQSPSGRGMWNGEPELPVLPSPWTFRFLKDLEQELASLGTDLWTPDARDEMKRQLRERLASSFAKLEKELSPSKSTNGENGSAKQHKRKESKSGKKANSTEEITEPAVTVETLPTQDTAIQMLFDVEYIDAISRKTETQTGDSLGSFRWWIREKSQLKSDQLETIRTAAEQYRKRTALLFALAN